MLDRAVKHALASYEYSLRTILYCEADKQAQSVLQARIEDKLLDNAPIWPDVRTLEISKLAGSVDCIIAGFPCQPFSVAGKRAGIQDQRYLFGDIVRLAQETGIPLLFLENVPGLLSGKDGETAPISDVMRILAEAGFNAKWCCVQASEAGAPHKRERFFCIAWKREELGNAAEE
ncbi:hypothetical protein BH10ACI4_BH10ACI4_25140 [soil metagenome]